MDGKFVLKQAAPELQVLHHAVEQNNTKHNVTYVMQINAEGTWCHTVKVYTLATCDDYMIWQDQDFSLKGFALSFENPTRRQSEHWESITNFWRDARYKSGGLDPPHKRQGRNEGN